MITPDEKARLDADPDAVSGRFRDAVLDSVRTWVSLADERLAGAGIPGYIILGNDDFPEIADVLRTGTSLQYGEDAILEIPGGHELLSFGYSTPTPWHTPRELTEDEMRAMLHDRVKQLERPHDAVLNVHCPPRDTHLDQAPELDANLRPKAGAGGMAITSVGSQAVRDVIEDVVPLLGLHGHVHESAGAQKIGGTLCINPGSEYGEGVLRGAIVELEDDGGVRQWQLVQG